MKNKLPLIFIICVFSLLFIACNNYTDNDFTADTYISYTLISSLEKDNCDLSRIKSINIYNYCCDSGWANTPASITFFSVGDGYKKHNRYVDTFFEDLPFASFATDKFGNSIVWDSSDTKTYNGSPKNITLRRTLNLHDIQRLVITYNLQTSSSFVNGGGMQIAFVDKNGNESEYIYISKNQ